MSFPFPLRISLSTTALLFVLAVSFIVRIGSLDYPLAFGWGDGPRDYLVAHHIVHFQEFPLIGPLNSLYQHGVRNSPTYYYLLSLFLLPYDSVFMLSLINVLFQLATIVLVYLLAKGLFGDPVSLIAATLFSFSAKVLEQSQFIWQPYLMQPFAYLSFFLLFLAYRTKRYLLIVTSLLSLIFAGTLHNTAYILLPQFIFFVLLLLRKIEAPLKKYVVLMLTAAAWVLSLYSPVLIYTWQTSPPFSHSYPLQTLTLTQYREHLLFNVRGIFHTIFSPQVSKPFSLEWLLALIVLGGLVTYLFFLKNRAEEKRYLIFILLTLIQIIFTASLFITNYQHYLILAYGLLTIIIAEVVFAVFMRSNKLRVAGIVISVLLFTTMSLHFSFLQRNSLSKMTTITQALRTIEDKLSLIKKREGFSDFRFFQVTSYVSHGEMIRFERLDAVFLVLLEEAFSEKLVVVNNSRENFSQLGSSEYIVLACYNFDYPEDASRCLHTFRGEYPSHGIVQHVYTYPPFSVYLTKRLSS